MAKQKNTFDAILASAPANATAARVTSKGTHFTPKMNEANHIAHWDAPPKMRKVDTSTGAPNLVGAKFGRFTVVGCLDDTNGASRKEIPIKWVVRCACGDYEVRTSRAVRNPANSEDRCRVCRTFEQRKRDLARLGSKPITDFT